VKKGARAATLQNPMCVSGVFVDPSLVLFKKS
jgi:hypothetical protein